MRILLFDTKAEYICIDRALRFFEPIKSDSVIVGYQVHIKFFKLVIEIVGLGSSFRITTHQVECAREEFTLGYLGGYNESKVSLFVRVDVVVYLQKLIKLLANCLIFSIAFDSLSEVCCRN